MTSIDFGGIGPENISLFQGESPLVFSVVLMMFKLLEILLLFFF